MPSKLYVWLPLVSLTSISDTLRGKQNQVAYYLSRKVQVNHIVAMSSYVIDLQEGILQEGHQDDRYMDILYRLQKSIGTSTGIGICD